jgi:hypothetical protein
MCLQSRSCLIVTKSTCIYSLAFCLQSKTATYTHSQLIPISSSKSDSHCPSLTCFPLEPLLEMEAPKRDQPTYMEAVFSPESDFFFRRNKNKIISFWHEKLIFFQFYQNFLLKIVVHCRARLFMLVHLSGQEFFSMHFVNSYF